MEGKRPEEQQHRASSHRQEGVDRAHRGHPGPAPAGTGRLRHSRLHRLGGPVQLVGTEGSGKGQEVLRFPMRLGQDQGERMVMSNDGGNDGGPHCAEN